MAATRDLAATSATFSPEKQGPSFFPQLRRRFIPRSLPTAESIFHPAPPEGGIAMGRCSLLLAGTYSPGSDPKPCRGPSHTPYQPRSGTRGGARRSAPPRPCPHCPSPDRELEADRCGRGLGPLREDWLVSGLHPLIGFAVPASLRHRLLTRSELQFHLLWNFLFMHTLWFFSGHNCVQKQSS